MTTPTNGIPDYLGPSAGAGGGDVSDVPLEVLQQIAQQATDAADFARRVQLWRDEQAALTQIAGQIPAGWQQIDATHFYNPGEGRVYELRATSTGKVTFDQYTAKDTASYLGSLGLLGSAGLTAAPSGGGGGIDQQALALQYDQLAAQYMNMGLDAEAARQQALTTLITNRNNLALGTAQTSAQIAQQAAQFAANPRDTYAEALYRGQVGGATPFGDLNNAAFGEYGKALAEKAAAIFQPVTSDLNLAREYARSIPPVDFFGPATRAQLGLPPTPAQALTGAAALPAVAAPPAAPPNALQAMLDRLIAMTPAEQTAFRQWTTGGAWQPPKAFAKGGTMQIGDMTRFGGYQPASSEGGTNMNIHEPSAVVGMQSGHVYATLAEGGYPEQLKVTPTPSGKKAAREAEKAGRGMTGMMGGAQPMAQGGTATVGDMENAYMKLLQRLTGEYGGGGSLTPFSGARFLAGAPYNAISQDPYLQAITEATYSMKGIDPNTLWAQVLRFMPSGIVNNFPRVSFA